MGRDNKKNKGGGKGISQPPPAYKLSKQEKKQAKKAGLRPDQFGAMRQREQMDLQLGQYGQGLLPQVGEAFSQPFDWNALPERYQGPDWDSLPQSPVSGDYNQWRQEQIQSSMDEFDAQMQPQFEKQQGDFRQQMYNRGIPEGSEQYNRLYDQMVKSQTEARKSYLQSAREGAANSANQFFQIGNQARQGAIGEGLQRYGFTDQQRGDVYNDMQQQRYGALNDYNQLMAARSPYDLQNLGYEQQRQLAQQQFGFNSQLARMGGGGGGGGSPAQPSWIQQGFPDYQAQAAFEDARKLNLYNAMNPRQSSPSPWSGFAGQAGGVLTGALIGGLF